MEFYCENERDAASYVECNLLHYPGYLAVCEETGEELTVSAGENNVLRVEIPPGYAGNIAVDFVGKGYWKAGNAVSLILWLGMLCFWFCGRKKRRLEEESK